jgi:hypothetical protein
VAGCDGVPGLLVLVPVPEVWAMAMLNISVNANNVNKFLRIESPPE